MTPHDRRPRRDVALIVTPRYLPLLGGMERECHLLALELRRRGYKPVVITEQLGHELPRREHRDGIEVLRIRSSPRRSLSVQLWVALRMTLHLLRFRRRATVVIVRTMTLPALVVGLLKRLRVLPVPTLVTAETADDVAALARRRLFSISRRLVDAHDRLNGICRANVEQLQRQGFPAERITFIPNGVNASAFATARTPTKICRFLFLGRIEPLKGIFELLEAFKAVAGRHAEARLTVAGEGPSRATLEERVRAAGLTHAVEFAGLVPYERLGELFGRVDCLVLPSYTEAMPLSLLEAAVHRVPIIVTDVGDVAEFLAGNARIVPPRDVAALTGAMMAAVEGEPPGTHYEALIARVDIATVADQLLRALAVAPRISR